MRLNKGRARALLRRRGGITYLLRDDFGTALSAGAVNGTLATDGINTRTVVDTTSKLAISVANGVEFTGASAAGNPALWYPAITRQAGLGVAMRVKPISANIIHSVGFDTNQTSDISEAFYLVTGELRAYFNTGGAQRNVLSGAYSNGNFYDLVVIARTTGYWFYVKGGAFTDWKLAFVWNLRTDTPLYPAVGVNSAVASGTFYLNKIRAAVLSQFASQYANATERKAVSVNNDTISAAAGDAIIEHTIVAATGVTQELMVRRTDDNNCLIIRMDQGASTIRVYEKNAGVETEKTGGSTAQTWTNGSSYRIHVSLYGSQVYVTVGTVNKNDATSSFNSSVAGVKVSHAGTDLIAWPSSATGAVKSQLDAFFPA